MLYNFLKMIIDRLSGRKWICEHCARIEYSRKRPYCKPCCHIEKSNAKMHKIKRVNNYD